MPRCLPWCARATAITASLPPRRPGSPARVFLPAIVPETRIARVAAKGAEVVRVPGTYDDAVRAAAEAARDDGLVLVADTGDDPHDPVVRDVMAGYGVIAQEIGAQLIGQAAPTHLFVQAGVGGLAAAMADGLHALLAAPARVVVVEPEAAACVAPALRAGRPVRIGGTLDTAAEMLSEHVDVNTHLMSDEWKAFVAIGEVFAAHDTVRHSDREYARGFVHANSVEGFNDRVRRTVAGVFHHITPHHADLYFNEVGFRWSQRVVTGQAVRRTRKGREVVKPLWSRITPALQLPAVFKSSVGRQLRRTIHGGIQIRCAVAVFG